MQTHQRFAPLKSFVRGNQAILIALMLALGAFGYAWLVWPTPYVIVHEKGIVFRVNRFTGVREESTDKGWMTKAQLYADQKQRDEEKAAEDRAKSDRILTELRLIKIDDTRDDFKKISIYNPTDWELSNSTEFGDDTIVEYYETRKNKESFLCKAERKNYFLKPHTHNDFSLTSTYGYDTPAEIKDLPGGTSFVQKITISFDTAMTVRNGSKEYVKLQPAFVLKHQRPWVSSSPNLEDGLLPP